MMMVPGGIGRPGPVVKTRCGVTWCDFVVVISERHVVELQGHVKSVVTKARSVVTGGR